MKEKLISCHYGKLDKFLLSTVIIYILLFICIISMKIIGYLKIQNLKEKESILIEPCLIYIGETLCFFYELIYKKNSYSKRDELLNNKEKKIIKLSIKDYAYFGLICLLFLIIDFYKIFILLFSQNISLASYCMLVKSSIFLILFSNLICYFVFKIKIYEFTKKLKKIKV